MEDKFVYTIRMFMEDYEGFDWTKTIVFTFRSGKQAYFYNSCWKAVCEKYLDYPLWNWTHTKDVMVITVNDVPRTDNKNRTWFPVILASYKHGGGLNAVAYDDVIICPQQPKDEKFATLGSEFKRRYYKSREDADRVCRILNSLKIRTERVRKSVTQGECAVYVNDMHIMNFSDELVLVPKNADENWFYGENIGGWMSCKSDAEFALAMFFEQKEETHNFEKIICQKLGIFQLEWI